MGRVRRKGNRMLLCWVQRRVRAPEADPASPVPHGVQASLPDNRERRGWL